MEQENKQLKENNQDLEEKIALLEVSVGTSTNKKKQLHYHNTLYNTILHNLVQYSLSFFHLPSSSFISSIWLSTQKQVASIKLQEEQQVASRTDELQQQM